MKTTNSLPIRSLGLIQPLQSPTAAAEVDDAGHS